ncbi:MAG: adenosylcobinamide amidohydrolase [Desulfobulbus sp.]|nr:adenosylcobinamide amidohydrolase [Desulfobulbus sp.]
MHIDTLYNGVEIYRQEKILYASFLKPHSILSTCPAAGGLRSDLTCLYNHQCCEPAGHSRHLPALTWNDAESYRRTICVQYDLPAEQCATLATAANMHNACIARQSFRGLTVAAICTGGVDANAGRAGDPATVLETEDGFEPLPPATEVPGPGTINTMIFISKPVTPGALTRSIVTATEAKVAVLQELAVNSRYSDGLATGTGTDQIAVAALENGDRPLTGSGKHVKLGEMIGRVVYEATKESLARQNQITPVSQCSAKIHLERFGLNRSGMQDMICTFLDQELGALLRSNFLAIERDPLTVAAVAALVHLKDKISWGVLPQTCQHEIMATYAAQVACAVSGQYEQLATYREQLTAPAAITDNHAFLVLVCRALALGFSQKWPMPTDISS